MIIKKVLFKKKKSNFKNLSKYILDENNNNAKVLVDYMLDNSMDKVEAYTFTNCSFKSKEDNIAEILNTQKLNTTSKQDKTMHLVVSFQEDEKPTIQTMQNVEKDIAKALGMENNQRLSVVHKNTNNLHIHIAINKVDPQTLKVINPYNDVFILQETAMKLEKKYRLKIDNHISNYEKKAKKYDHSFVMSFENWAKEMISEQAKELLKNENTEFKDIVKLLDQYDLEFKERRNGFCISSKSETLFCKASSINRAFSKHQLVKRFGKIFSKDFIAQDSFEDINKKFSLTPTNKDSIKSKIWEEYLANENKKNESKQAELIKLKLERELYRSRALRSLKKEYFKEKKHAIFEKYKRKSYRDFLIDKVMNGSNDEDVILALRNTKIKLEENENNLFSDKNSAQIFKNVQYVTKEGYAVYKEENNKIIDKGNFLKISLQDNNREILLSSLLMAIDRFGKELNITGSDGFKKEILDVANEFNLDVKFTDINMEKINKVYKQRKVEIDIKKLLKKATINNIEFIKLNKNKKDKVKEKNIKMLEKILSKLDKSNVAIFKGDLNKIGIDEECVSKLDISKKIKMKIDGFLINSNNIQGIDEMNNEVIKNLSQGKNNESKQAELIKFEKFKYLLENTEKISDITLGFYENRGIDTQYYIKKYNMEVVKLDKVANTLELSNKNNFNIINKYLTDKLLLKQEKIQTMQFENNI